MRRNRSHVLNELAAARTIDRLPDFRGWDLGWADLSGLDLAWARMENTYLYGASLRGANLAGVDLRNATVQADQLLDARGLCWSFPHRISDEMWDEIMPHGSDARGLFEELLGDWDGTLREAVATAETLHRA